MSGSHNKLKELNLNDSPGQQKKCGNCETILINQASYCHHCGQATVEGENLLTFFKQFLKDYFTFDSKIFRSIGPLFTKPGWLTLEYLEGRRVKYIPPLRLFIFSSIIFFLFLSLLDKPPADQLSEADAYWDNFFESWLPKLFFLLSPLFAFLLALFFKKRNRSILVHFLFSLHFHATLFSVGSIYLLISWTFAQFDLLFLNRILIVLFGVFLMAYLIKGLLKVFQETIFGTLWRFLLLIILYLLLIGGSTLFLALISR